MNMYQVGRGAAAAGMLAALTACSAVSSIGNVLGGIIPGGGSQSQVSGYVSGVDTRAQVIGLQQPNGQPWPPQNHQFPPQVPPGQHPPFMPPHHHPKRKSWPARHKVLTGLMAVGALIVIIVGGGILFATGTLGGSKSSTVKLELPKVTTK